MLEPVGSHNAGTARAATTAPRACGAAWQQGVHCRCAKCSPTDSCNETASDPASCGNRTWRVVTSSLMRVRRRRSSSLQNTAVAPPSTQGQPHPLPAPPGDVDPLTSPRVAGPLARHRRPTRRKLAAMGNPNDRASASPIRRARRLRPTTRWATTAIAAAVVVTSGTACSDDDERAGGDGTPTTSETTSTTQPPATDEASHEVVEELVIEATGLADELFQDPSAVDDPDSEALDRLREIYTDDSPTPDGIEDELRELVANGQRQRPSETGIFREVSVYGFEPVDEDTLTFDTCNQIDFETVNADDTVVDTQAMVVFVEGTARRVDGVWRFHGLSDDVTRSNPIEPGQSEAGLCEQLASERDDE
jgi:hypothetical protein